MGIFSKIFGDNKVQLQNDFNDNNTSNKDVQTSTDDSKSNITQKNTEPSPFLVEDELKEKE